MNNYFLIVSGTEGVALRQFIWVMLVLFSSFTAHSFEKIEFTSSSQRPLLLELYSSQGCSSCPPAQKWVNSFTESPDLWSKFIPIVFHVDYWDYIGWKDPFSSAEFSNRQRSFKSAGLINSVYTPGFVVNGHEWKGWFTGNAIDTSKLERTSNITLTVSAEQERVRVNYDYIDPRKAEEGRIHVAVLGFDVETQVKAGENAHRTLRDNFMVLGYQQQKMHSVQHVIQYPKLSATAKKYALVVWTSKPNGLVPTQAVGGYLPQSFNF
ncbi:DUF1223 domain-containing protein [Paraglaciecola marina]|uniref:DUF1223 domain-containing protein n=1 Tax=Paraglaciecola marina TaxID=2500157 RepID=UPI0010608A57|nr:DUF1223 domain-containing protein [Paraglaciecola marina]